MKPPGQLNVDISTAEGQPLGVPVSFGEPFYRHFDMQKEFIRQLPGRIIGQTVDKNNKISYALTLQTREQHIRRESATSNICTSTQLIGSLMVAVYLATMGPEIIKSIAETCYHRAHYFAEKLNNIEGLRLISDNFFNEFVIESEIDLSKINKILQENNIEGGIDISDNKSNKILFAVTELNSPEIINKTINLLGGEND